MSRSAAVVTAVQVRRSLVAYGRGGGEVATAVLVRRHLLAMGGEERRVVAHPHLHPAPLPPHLLQEMQAVDTAVAVLRANAADHE